MRSNAGAVRAAVQEGTHRVEEALAVSRPIATSSLVGAGWRWPRLYALFWRMLFTNTLQLQWVITGLQNGRRSIRFQGASQLVYPFFPLKQLSPASS